MCPITQQEIADNLRCSKAIVNMVLNELIDNSHVEIYKNTKGRYVLLDEAKRIMKGH